MITLAATPNDYRRILDNAEAKLVLIQIGLLDKLLEHGQRPKSVPLTEPWSARIYFTDHPTHWLVADYYTGFPNPADNGFAVDCIPKSRVTLEQFRSLERQHAAQRFPHGIESGESGTHGPPAN